MSGKPEIMKAIAKTILANSKKQQKQSSEANLQKEQSGHEGSPSQAQESESRETPSRDKEASQTCPNQQHDQEILDKSKEFFIKSQSKRLKLLYPTFKDQHMAKVAEQIWNELKQDEREFYCSKWEISNEQEDVKSIPYQEIEDLKENGKQDDEGADQSETKNEPVIQNEHQISIAEPSSSDSSQSQPRDVSFASAGGRSNAETNVSSVQNDQSNHVPLPQIFTLIQCSVSGGPNSEQEYTNLIILKPEEEKEKEKNNETKADNKKEEGK